MNKPKTDKRPVTILQREFGDFADPVNYIPLAVLVPVTGVSFIYGEYATAVALSYASFVSIPVTALIRKIDHDRIYREAYTMVIRAIQEGRYPVVEEKRTSEKLDDMVRR